MTYLLFHGKHLDKAIRAYVDEVRGSEPVTVEICYGVGQAITPLRFKALREYARRRKVKLVLVR